VKILILVSGFGPEGRERLDLVPAFALFDAFDRDSIEIVVEHGIAFLSEGWTAIVLFFPQSVAGLAVEPCSPECDGECPTERSHRFELAVSEAIVEF
jgi:hypothetical protein